MRTRSALDIALLSSPAMARSTYAKVEVDRTGSGAWVDLSDWNGIDYVRSVRYGETVDQPAWTAVVSLSLWDRDLPETSTSPLMANSLVNTAGVLCRPYRKIRISTATVPQGDPKPATYNEVFLGRIDSYRLSGGTLELSCRDQAGDLMDRFIRVEQWYGSDTPTTATANEAQEIIQNLIDDHYNTASDISGTASAPRANKLSARTTDGAPYQLYSANGTAATPWSAAVGTDTGWSIRYFLANKSPLWQWLQTITDQIGYRLRFRWHEGSGIDAFVLVLEEPDRTSPSSSITLDPTLGQCRVTGIANSAQNVRNLWRVGYAKDGGAADSVTATNAASVTKYGERYAEVNEDASSQIDSSTEAQAMADAFLADTKEPTATVGVTMPYAWYLQTNDLVTVNADDIHFDSAQTLTLVSRQNMIQQGGAATSELTLQGTLETGRTRKPQRVFRRRRRSPAVKATQRLRRLSLVPNSDFGDNDDE